MKINVYMQARASYTASVALSDDELRQLAAECGTTVDKLTVDDVRELAEDKVFMKGVPGLCFKEVIDLGDWEPQYETKDAVEITER